MTIVAAADGSALGNPGPAGWAWYVDDDRWSAGGWPHGTNNQGELMAVIDLLESTAHVDDDLHILCDSQYVINAVTKWMAGWKRKGWRKADGAPVLNRELLERLDRALQGRRYAFEWVKGHAGHDLNEAADVRARAVATAYQKGDPIPIGPGWPHVGSEKDRPAAIASTVDTPAPAAPPAEQAAAPVSSRTEEALELDIFGELAVSESDEEIVGRLERELLDPAVRSDASRVAGLLHPEFAEIGRSGRLWGRDDTIQALADETSEPVGFDLLGTDIVSDGVILLTARTTDARGGTLRSSLWQRSGDRWRLRFHQGTPEA